MKDGHERPFRKCSVLLNPETQGFSRDKYQFLEAIICDFQAGLCFYGSE